MRCHCVHDFLVVGVEGLDGGWDGMGRKARSRAADALVDAISLRELEMTSPHLVPKFTTFYSHRIFPLILFQICNACFCLLRYYF